MDEKLLLKRLSRGSQQALETVILKYSAYVVAVIHNRSRGCLSPEDEEEIASDVFFSLWQHAGTIEPGHLKPWLGSVARNSTVSRLRKRKLAVPLEENLLVLDDPQWESLSKKDQARQLQQALMALSPQDREIFYRFYDLCETTTQISTAMKMPASTVRTRLSRGRDTLRNTLCQGGFLYENEY